jgi:hypothetical protein
MKRTKQARDHSFFIEKTQDRIEEVISKLELRYHDDVQFQKSDRSSLFQETPSICPSTDGSGGGTF